jgi:putative membrane protein
MKEASSGPPDANRLALERTLLAYERTLMGWIRTAIGLISFGFTIAKFFEYLHKSQGTVAPVLGARTVGLSMICLGLISLLLATVSMRQRAVFLRHYLPEARRSPVGVLAVLISLLGIAAFVGAILRH